MLNFQGSLAIENSRKTRLHQFSGQDFTHMIKNWQSLVSPHGIGSPASVQSLFNTSLPTSPVSSPRILNPSGSINKRTGVDQRLLNVTQRVSPQQTPRQQVPSGGNNLLPSFAPRGPLTPSIVRHSVPSCSSRSFGNLNCANSSRNINKTSLSTTSNVRNSQVNNPSTVFPKNAESSSSSSKSFKFDPVIVTPERNIQIFPPRQSKDVQSTTVPNSSIQSPDLGNNNCKVMLSQSSQLTAEEQSLVESVFDGIDADSLFDDDF
ncbi:hypothetical protein J6590_003091 [Homalodisca vitripennis]|nr:hypothetical protein J6590_003091 [Homalodisca vitripennis]